MKYKDFTVNITEIYKNIKRDYLKRMNDDKVNTCIIAKKFDKEFWDGDRKYGYGGYKYDGRWKPVAEKLISYYKLNSGMKILDIGCGKGYLLYELKKLNPKLEIYGIDISKYAIENGKEEIKNCLQVGLAQDLPWKDKYFDLVVSLGTLHNLYIYDLKKAIQEMERVGKNKYITVEAYRNEQEKFNLMCWVLTAECFFTDKEWEWLFDEFGYTGEYSFFYFN